MLRRQFRFAFCLLLATTVLSACSSTFLSKRNSSNYKEQLYIDARLYFAIKHPLNWKLQTIPVSLPEYNADTITWVAVDPLQKTASVGTFQIRSEAGDENKTLPDLLSSFLATMPELNSGLVENIEHPAGAALKLVGHDDDRGRLTIAIKGQQRDFIISLDYPSNRFDDLLPVFEEIVASFVEILRPATEQSQSPQ